MGWFRDYFGIYPDWIDEANKNIMRDIAWDLQDKLNNAAIYAHVKHQHLMKMNKTHGVVVSDVVYQKGEYIKLHAPDVADTPTSNEH